MTTGFCFSRLVVLMVLKSRAHNSKAYNEREILLRLFSLMFFSWMLGCMEDREKYVCFPWQEKLFADARAMVTTDTRKKISLENLIGCGFFYVSFSTELMQRPTKSKQGCRFNIFLHITVSHSLLNSVMLLFFIQIYVSMLSGSVQRKTWRTTWTTEEGKRCKNILRVL